MLIFTYKLERYIKKKILPKILLCPNRYRFAGSFRRRTPYVTDIDVVSTSYPEINSTNIYEKILDLIKKFSTKEYNDIIFIYIICGVDDRFKLDTASDEELSKIKLYLNNEEKADISIIQQKYQNNYDRKIPIYDIISRYYKLRWTKKNIIDNEMILPGDIKIKFTDIIKKNQLMIFQYFVNIEAQPVGFDVVVNYEPINMLNLYADAANKYVIHANFYKEYYFMMFPFRAYFRKNEKIYNELNNVIEKKFGLYKQLMVRIETYIKLYGTNNLNIRTATLMINSIKKDAERLPGFSSNVLDEIAKIAINDKPESKIEKWYYKLDKLYKDINTAVNLAAKNYFFKFLDLVPENDRKKFYLQYSK